jgi:MFS family permease
LLAIAIARAARQHGPARELTMADDVVTLDEVIVEAPAQGISDKDRRRLFLFGGALMLLISFSDPSVGLTSIPVSFFLKNRLHLAAHDLALFRVITGVPLFLSFVFGFVRDRWSAMGRSDSGLLILFGTATALVYAVLTFLSPTYGVLLWGLVVATSAFQLVLSAAAGLLSTIGQQRAMAGQVGALMNIASTAPVIASALLGGLLSDYLEGRGSISAARTLFLIAAGLLLGVALVGVLRPRALFGVARAQGESSHFFQDVVRLLRHRPIYPILLLQVLWQFSPAFGVVLQYHMANDLHGTDFQWGLWNALFFGSFVPVFVGYGFLCQRFPLKGLLWFGFILATLQAAPLLVVHTAVGALIAAVPMAIIGGLAQGALTDLAIRACPSRLQGTMMMLFATSFYAVGWRIGDLIGSDLYDHHGGFYTTVWAQMLIYLLILPVLLMVPRHLLSTRDGEALEAG